MIYSNNTPSYEFSEEKCIYYTVLKTLIGMKRRGEMPVSAFEIQQSIKNFIVSLNQIEGVLNELYNHSLLMMGGVVGEETRYDLQFF